MTTLNHSSIAHSSQSILVVTHAQVNEDLLRKYIAKDFFAGKLNSIIELSSDDANLEFQWELLLNSRRIKTDHYAKKQDFRQSVMELYESYEQETLIFLGNLTQYSIQLQEGMLRLLEEPPSNAFVVLFVNDLSSVLSTIRSRSRIVSLNSEMVFKLLRPDLSESVQKKLPAPQTTVKHIINHQEVVVDAIAKLDREEIDLWLWQLQTYLEQYYQQDTRFTIGQALTRVLQAKKFNQSNMLKRLVIESLN